MNELANRIKERLITFIAAQGLTKSSFEKKCGLSNGYINNFKGNLGGGKLEDILSAFPDLSREWLIYGEGEMLNSSVVQNNQNGDNINGHSVTVNKTETDSFIELLKKKDEQIDRLLTIIENMNK